MRKIPAIKNVMTPFPYHVDVGASLDSAKQLMTQHRIRHLPVMEKNELVGVVSERDVHTLLENLTIGRGEQELAVRDACVEELYVVDLNERLDNVLLQMANRRIGSALVTKQGRLAGLFTLTDACRCFAEFLRDHEHADDAQALFFTRTQGGFHIRLDSVFDRHYSGSAPAAVISTGAGGDWSRGPFF